MHQHRRPAVALILLAFLSGTHRLSAALEFDMLFEKDNADRPVEMDVKV